MRRQDSSANPRPRQCTEPYGVALKSDKVDAKTGEAVVPMMPANLTAEVARDTNVAGSGSRGALLLWNAPTDPEGAKVTGYKIERSINGGEYSIRVENMPADRTYWVDRTELGTNTHMYRVTSRNAVGPGTEMATVMIPYPEDGHTHAPVSTALTAPTMVMGMSDTDGVLTLTWEGGDNADSFVLIAVRTDTFAYTSLPIADGAARMGTFTGLTSGVDYIGIVVALKGTGDALQTPYGSTGSVTVQ